MVVAGIVGVINRYGNCWNTAIQLRDTNVVLDTTGACYWFVKNQLLARTRMNEYGTSMPDLGQFYRNLFKRFRERNVRPIVVYEGGRRSEREGMIVSKAHHLRHSAGAALRSLNQGRFGNISSLPQLSINCLKEVVREFGLGADQVYQAEGEVYPLLVQLADRFKCPVVTHHTDFIFQDAPKGFIRLDQINLPNDDTQPIDCRIYWHRELLRTFNLTPEHSGSLSCLPILLRDDFVETYYDTINKVLMLERAGRFRLGPNVRFARVKTARLEHVLKYWSRTRLTSSESVRSAMLAHSSAGPHLTRDYDALRDAYARAIPFEQSEVARTLSAGADQIPGGLQEALTQRESSIEFLCDVIQTNFNRTGIEDPHTHRSTFSLQDRTKEYLLERMRGPKSELSLHDRCRDRMQDRHLRPVTQIHRGLDRETLFELFHFDDKKFNRISSQLCHTIQLDQDHSERLTLLLLLASFALRLMPRENYNNTLDDQSAPLSLTGSSGSDSQQPTRFYTLAETRQMLFLAILNSYVYLQMRGHQGDESRQNVPADTRVAQDKVETIVQAPSGVQCANTRGYLTLKHLVEGLNSTLHAYKETNSLYGEPGPSLLVNKYYDAVIIYKIMAKYSKNLQGHLLQLHADILSDLS